MDSLTLSHPNLLYAQQEAHLQLLEEAFLYNERLRNMVGKSTENDIDKGVKKILCYAYKRTKRHGHIYCSSNQSAILLYYQKSKFTMGLRDMLDEADLAVNGLGLKNILPLLSEMDLVTQARKQEAEKQGDTDYLYIWFMAQKQGVHGLKELVELKTKVLDEARKNQLPVYIELTNKRLKKVYERIGFSMYNHLQLPLTKCNLWMGRLF